MKGLFHSTVGACLLAGVVLVSSGFAVVWRVVKASTTSTTTTTTVAPTTTSAPKVAVVAPRVVSASSATGNAVITIADMSPDTGVYAVQWVLSDQDFNSYQMYRTTTKTMTVPFLSCTRTYTLRVFVMQENWQMTDGFVNQNVTPHSATFDLTMPACSATATAAAATTTTVALTCATGGTCDVGDTGPGGGIVFYVSATNFASTGSDCNTACKYLEAAPVAQSTGIAWATTTANCYSLNLNTGNQDCQKNSIYSGTGQTVTHRLQPTHSDSSTCGTRVPSCGWMHWCAPSWHAATQSWQPMHLSASILATVS